MRSYVNNYTKPLIKGVLMNKYEKLIEYIINDNEQKARELFHEIVVEKSRDIYESLMDQEVEETVGGNAVDSLVDEISADEEGISEDDLEGDEEFDLGDEEGDEMDFNQDGDIDAHEEEHGDVEDRVQDLEDALDELKAEFDQLMGGEEGSEEGADEFGGEQEVGAEEEPAFGESVEQVEEAKAGSGSGNPFAKSGSGKSGSGKSGSGKSGSGKSGSGKMNEGEMMREYVEKIKEFYKGDNSEGSEVGNGGSVAVNKQSEVAGKNDMGGTAANIAKGGAEQAPDGTSPKKASNAYTKGQGTINSGNRNVPGADAGKLEKAPTAKRTGEVGGTNTKSIEG
jgi:hypothetical protein